MPAPEALSQEALNRWERMQREAHARHMATRAVLKRLDDERKDSAQRTNPPPGFEDHRRTTSSSDSSRLNSNEQEFFASFSGSVNDPGAASPSSKRPFHDLDVDPDGYGEAMRSLFGPCESDDNISLYILNEQEPEAEIGPLHLSFSTSHDST